MSGNQQNTKRNYMAADVTPRKSRSGELLEYAIDSFHLLDVAPKNKCKVKKKK